MNCEQCVLDWVPARTGDDQVTFYTVGNDGYFLGTLALLNSLRVTGHDGALVVLDCGLTTQQRERLRPYCTLVDRPPEHVTNPMLFQPFAYLLRPTGVVVILDSDMIVTRSLGEVIALANQGKISVFPDDFETRWYGDWQHIFGLRSVLRRQPYVNGGFIAFSTMHWPNLLAQWWQASQRIWTHPTLHEGVIEGPTLSGPQDALNAVLMSEVPAGALALLPREEGPASPALQHGVRVVDERRLACQYRGHAPLLLHSTGLPKPWQPGAYVRLRRNAYVRLLPRLLLAPDVPVRMTPTELPLWLRGGAVGSLSLYLLDIINRVGWGILNHPTYGPVAQWLIRHLSPVHDVVKW